MTNDDVDHIYDVIGRQPDYTVVAGEPIYAVLNKPTITAPDTNPEYINFDPYAVKTEVPDHQTLQQQQPESLPDYVNFDPLLSVPPAGDIRSSHSSTDELNRVFGASDVMSMYENIQPPVYHSNAEAVSTLVRDPLLHNDHLWPSTLCAQCSTAEFCASIRWTE